MFTTSVVARNLMNAHGLHDWQFKFDKAKRRAGVCKHSKKVISLSLHYVTKNPEDEIRDTILHEIAHALAGPGEGHGLIWKSICIRIGAKPIRCYSAQVVMPEGRWKATCPNCQRIFKRHRRSRFRRYYCPSCGREKGQLTFV